MTRALRHRKTALAAVAIQNSAGADLDCIAAVTPDHDPGLE